MSNPRCAEAGDAAADCRRCAGNHGSGYSFLTRSRFQRDVGMAFVILSTGTITRSRLHTFRISTLLLSAGLVLLLTLAGALRVGYTYGRAAPAVAAAASAVPDASYTEFLERPEGRALIERIGTLSGRVIQLETEAQALAARIGLIQDIGRRTGRPGAAADSTGTSAAVPAGPSGGPFLPAPPDAEAPAAGAGSREPPGLRRLERELEQLDATLDLLASATMPLELAGMAFPSRLPVNAPRITSGFGLRMDPMTRRRARHTGIDFAAPRNSLIRAAGGGRVVFAGYRSAYGNTVEIDHGNGLSTRYAHASRLLVRRGEIVLPAQAIAAVGSTGRSTGPHVHFEVLRNGRPVEPRDFLHPTDT